MALYLQIPVQRTCIHKSPVHGAYNHNMDGNAWYFTLGFPSISLAYIYFPSRRIVYSIPCHRSHLPPSPLSFPLNYTSQCDICHLKTITGAIFLLTRSSPGCFQGSLRTQETAGADYIWNNTSSTA